MIYKTHKSVSAWLAPLELGLGRACAHKGGEIVEFPASEQHACDVIMEEALQRAMERSPTLRTEFATASVTKNEAGNSLPSIELANGGDTLHEAREKNDCFTILPVSMSDADALAQLADSEGDAVLERNNRQAYADACRNHDGLVMKSPEGTVIGSCFVGRRELRFHRSTHWAPDVQAVTYVSRFVLAKSYRGRGLGRDLLRSAIAFEYGRWEGPFPDVVGVAFEDSYMSRAFSSLGCFQVDEDSFARNIHRTVFAAATMVDRLKETMNSRSKVEIEVLDSSQLPDIARWALAAFTPEGIFDDATGTIVRMIDASDGRNGIVSELRNLATMHPVALGRLGMYRRDSKRTTSSRRPLACLPSHT